MDGLLGSIALVGDGKPAGRCIEYLHMTAPDHILSQHGAYAHMQNVSTALPIPSPSTKNRTVGVTEEHMPASAHLGIRSLCRYITTVCSLALGSHGNVVR
jgi:hypothetical protein